MDALEGAHWWYRGLRGLIQATLQTPPLRLRTQSRILDAGCGTGATLRSLIERFHPAYSGGFDISPQAVGLCRAKAPGADVYISDIRQPELHAGDLDLVLSCDVASIAGMEQSLPGMARIVAALRRGGLLILNLPAFRWLRSGHDRAIGTRDRVDLRQVGQYLGTLGLNVKLATYRVFTLFPAIVAARLPSVLFPGQDPPASDLKAYPQWLNQALYSTVSAENRAILQGVRLPWGSSVYAVGRKP